MFCKKQYLPVAVIIFLCILFGSVFLSAQTQCAVPGLTVNLLMTTRQDHKSPAQMEFVRCFRETVRKSKDLVLSDQPVFVIYAAVQEIPDDDRIMVSLVTTQTIPPEVVKLAAENEIFYKVYDQKPVLPEEGKFMREYMTSEWMISYRLILNHEVLSISRDEIPSTCVKVIDNFMEKFIVQKRKKEIK